MRTPMRLATRRRAGRYALVTGAVSAVLLLAFGSAPGPTAARGATATLSAVTSTEPTIYDQNDVPNGSQAYSNSGGSSGSSYDSQAADDFAVPAGQTWTISEIDVTGANESYYSCSGAGDSVNVFVYDDASGAPGTLLYSDTVTAADGLGQNGCSFAIPVDVGPLATGHYWLSVQANDPSQWYWRMRGNIANDYSMWQNPANGWTTGCTTWGNLGACVAGFLRADLMFALHGTKSASGHQALSDQDDHYSFDAVPSSVDSGTEAVDDFVVPSSTTWHLTSVFVPGWAGTLTSDVTVKVYDDDSGALGSVEYTTAVPAASITQAPGPSTFWSGGTLLIPVDVTLTAGHYWLSVQAGGSDAWYWAVRSAVTGDEAMSSQGTTCSSWDTLENCYSTLLWPADLMFTLFGTAQGGALTPSDGGPLSVIVSEPLDATLGSFTDSNTKATAGDFSATVCWNDLDTPQPNDCGTATVTGGNGSFTVSGSHTFAASRSYSAVTTVTDTWATETTIHTTVDVSDLLTPTDGGPLSATANEPLTDAVLGTFTDSNLDAVAGDFTADICWNDTGAAPSDCTTGTVSGGSGSFTVTGSHTFKVSGSYVVTTVAHDASGLNRAELSTTVEVANPVLYDQDDDDFGGAVPSATEFQGYGPAQAADDFVVPAGTSWHLTEVDATGSGSDCSGTSVNVFLYGDASGTPGTPVYTAALDEGDGVSITGECSFSIPVDATLAPGHYWLSVQADGADNWSWELRSTVAGTAAMWQISSDPFGTGCSSWGDVNTCVGGWLGQPVDLMFTLRGSSTSSGGPLTPTNGGPLDALEGKALGNAVLGTFTDSDATAISKSFSAEVCWGDGRSCDRAAVKGGQGAFTVTGKHTYAAAGGYTAVTTVTDAAGNTTTIETVVNVADAPLKIAGKVKVTVKPGQPVTVAANFTDGNKKATIDHFSATIDWGDGSSGTGQIVARKGGWSVTGSHTYSVTQHVAYTVTITIDDVGGATVGATATVKFR